MHKTAKFSWQGGAPYGRQSVNSLVNSLIVWKRNFSNRFQGHSKEQGTHSAQSNWLTRESGKQWTLFSVKFWLDQRPKYSLKLGKAR